MKLSKRIKAFILSLVMSISCISSGCEFGLADIPKDLIFPDMGDQDMVSYLGNMLLENYKDTIIQMLTDGLKDELDSGNLDEFFGDMLESQYDNIIDTLFVQNRDKMVDELKSIFSGNEEVEGLLDDELFVNDIVSNIIDNESFKTKIMDYLMDTEDNDSLINQLAKNPDFISAMVGNEEFLSALSENDYFNDYMNWVIASQLHEAGKSMVPNPFPNPGEKPDPKDAKYQTTTP